MRANAITYVYQFQTDNYDRFVKSHLDSRIKQYHQLDYAHFNTTLHIIVALFKIWKIGHI